MQVDVHGWHTDIRLTPEEMAQLCTPGKGVNTCIWLVVGRDGFECSYFHRNPSLIRRLENGKTVAKRDGCDFVKAIDPSELGAGMHELEVPI